MDKGGGKSKGGRRDKDIGGMSSVTLDWVSAKLDQHENAREVVGRSAKLKELAAKVGEIVAEKNIVYGDAFNTSADALRILYPDGINPDEYRDVLLFARIWDKLSRIATNKYALGESPYQDIAGYAILGMDDPKTPS
jgi:hypothetical protein